MRKTTALMELPATVRHRSQDSRNDSCRDTLPNGAVLIEKMFENMTDKDRKGALKRIASLPDTRRGTVLDIRRQLTEGTYEVTDRLAQAMDRVLETIIT